MLAEVIKYHTCWYSLTLAVIIRIMILSGWASPLGGALLGGTPMAHFPVGSVPLPSQVGCSDLM